MSFVGTVSRNGFIRNITLPTNEEVQQYRNAVHDARHHRHGSAPNWKSGLSDSTAIAANAFAFLVHFAHPRCGRDAVACAVRKEFNILLTDGQVRGMIEPKRSTGAKGSNPRNPIVTAAFSIANDDNENDNNNNSTNAVDDNFGNDDNNNNNNSSFVDDAENSEVVDRAATIATKSVVPTSSASSATARDHRISRVISLTTQPLFKPNLEYQIYVEEVN